MRHLPYQDKRKKPIQFRSKQDSILASNNCLNECTFAANFHFLAVLVTELLKFDEKKFSALLHFDIQVSTNTPLWPSLEFKLILIVSRWLVRSPLVPTVHIFVRMVFGNSLGIAS